MLRGRLDRGRAAWRHLRAQKSGILDKERVEIWVKHELGARPIMWNHVVTII